MPIDQSLPQQVEIYLTHLEKLKRRGNELRDALQADPANSEVLASTRSWQEDCGTTMNQLSGGSKAHWLARAFSQAFLVRSADGRAAEGAAPADIVMRLLDVLEQAAASLSGMSNGSSDSQSSAPSAPRRFDFVRNAELRPVVEQAYVESKRALDHGEYQLAFQTSCGILEAIVTDALERQEQNDLSLLAAAGAPSEKISDWSFSTRLAVAESAGLIRGGCARLPAVARTYRDHADVSNGDGATISEREARQTGQVLNVIMRDLDPGR
jgi:hypothetical protein